VKLSCRGRVTSGHNYPGIGVGTVSPTGVQVSVGNSAPDDHFGAGPHRGVKRSASSRVGVASGYPTIGRGIVSPASVEVLGRPSAIISTSPDNHFTASPHCGVTLSCRRRVIGARAYPSIVAGIGSSAGVRTNEEGTFSAPDDHFTAGPDRRVLESASGRVGGAGGCPTIRARIISPAVVQRRAVVKSAPDDHFTAGPYCGVVAPASGRVGEAGGRPAIVCACRITFGNSWKRVRVVFVGAAWSSPFHRHTSQMFTASRAEASFVVRR